jgi:shikimate O-hydroxycinnamoyltransferase
MDTASGDGIEALVHLKEEDMAKFQEDEELLQYIVPTKC